MKIENNNGMFTVSFGIENNGERDDRVTKTKGGDVTIFAGDLGRDNGENAIEKKKKEIRDKAAQVLKDKFARDLEQDDMLKESQSKIETARADQKEALERINELKEYIEEAPEDLDEDTLRTYREGVQTAQGDLADAQRREMSENASIRSAKKADLAQRYEGSMSWAVDQEEKVLAAGSDEIVGMAVKAAMEQIEEKYDENIENAQEQKEEKEKEQEKLDELKENKAQIMDQVEAAKAEAMKEQEKTTSEVNDVVTESSDIDKQLRKIQKEAELMDEDLKGLVVNTQL
ncbi:hypothetical protein V1224_11720 [Lachnospiraceae bacterium JLR.KK008]